MSVKITFIGAGSLGFTRTLNQAMLLDPLVGAVCTPDEVEQMTDEMLLAEARWLPQYRHVIPAVKRRFASAPRLARFGTEGAARKKMADVKTVSARNAATAAKRKSGRMLNITEPEG